MQREEFDSKEILGLEPDDGPRGKDTIRIRRFQAWMAGHPAARVDRFLFLEFAAEVGSRGALIDLEKALQRSLSGCEALKAELRAAVTDHRRRVDGRKMRSEILAAAWWKPFLPQSNMDILHIHEVARLDTWLRWLHERGIRSPGSQDYISFASKWASEQPLTALQATFAKLGIPRVPSVEIELNLAISGIRAKRTGAGQRVRTSWPRRLSVAPDELPPNWRALLDAIMERGEDASHVRISRKFLPTVEGALRTLCFCCGREGRVPEISEQTALLLVEELKGRGVRAATLQITVSALARIAVPLGVDEAQISRLRRIEQELHRKRRGEIPLKFSRLSKVGSVRRVLGLAVDLLAASKDETSLELRVAKLNGATALALFSLLPLRVADTNLRWGEELSFNGTRYRLDLCTSKTGAEFHGEICDFVTPFLDAMLLRGCDARFLDSERKKALQAKKNLFCHANGRYLSEKRVSNLWWRHLGIRPHIARTLIHSELGSLGAEGVEMALSMCAQRDPKTAAFYQGRAMHDALLLQGTCALLSGLSDEQVALQFPTLEDQLEAFGA